MELGQTMPTLRQKIVSTFTRRYPFLSGCGTIANSSLIRMAAGSRGESTWTRLKSGPEILVPLQDYVGKAAYFVGDLDRKISETIKRIVRPGDHVLDIGANLGVVTLHLAKLVGPTGIVHSFEPNPAVNELLSRSIERNNLKNVRLHTCALGATDGGTLELSFPEQNAGQATLTQTRPGEGWRSVQVPVKTLSALADEAGIGKIRLIKIDVEGFEKEVLTGARAWMTANPPDAIIFESNESLADGEADPVVSMLTELGYVIYSIPKRLFSLRLAPFRPNDKQEIKANDLLAVRKDCQQEIVSKFNILAATEPRP